MHIKLKYIFFTVYNPDQVIQANKKDRLPMWYQKVEDNSAENIEKKIQDKIPDHLRSRFVLEVVDNLPITGLSKIYKPAKSAWTVIHYVEQDFNKALADARDFVGDIKLDVTKLKSYDGIACSNKPIEDGAAPMIRLFFLQYSNQSQEYFLVPDPRFAMSRGSSEVVLDHYLMQADTVKQKYHGKTVNEVVNKLARNYAYVQDAHCEYPLKGRFN